MKHKNFLYPVFTTSCILVLLTACGTAVRQTPSAASDPTGSQPYDTANEAAGYITLAKAKSTVLENAGLSEDHVKFVRTKLTSDHDTAVYDLEFICEDAEYDYTIHAVTGEILSMNCETNSYDMGASAADTTQTADIQSDTQTQWNESAATEPSKTGNDTDNQQYIGTEAAKQAALNHAGLQETDVHFVHAHLEVDNGYWKYDIEFHKDNTEYDYDIDALSGEILSYDQDAEYYQHSAAASSSNEQITEEEAKQIALNHAGVAEKDTQYLKIDFDYDDGLAEYEIEWHVGRMEYSCDIDAYTGEITGFEKEVD